MPSIFPDLKEKQLEKLALKTNKIIGKYSNSKKIVLSKEMQNEILYIKSSLNNVEYHLDNGTTQVVRDRLDIVLESLNPYIFARTHNRFVVNMNHVDTVDYPNMDIKIDNGEFVGISRGYKKKFEEAYLRFTRNFS